MTTNTRKKRFIQLLILFLITRSLYSFVGLYSRAEYLDKNEPFPSWTYDSKHELINIWTVWDSGFYYEIAEKGYLNNLDGLKTTLELPAGTWLKVFMGTGQIGDQRFDLPSGTQEKPVSNTLVILGDALEPTTVDLHRVYPGIPVCSYQGDIDFERDVLTSKEALESETACLDRACSASYITYYSAKNNKVIYQEVFSDVSSGLATRKLGVSRPEGYKGSEFQDLGCVSISEDDLSVDTLIDYTSQISSYPFLPLYSNLSGHFGNLLGDIIVAGLIVSNISTLLSAVLLYMLIKLDFDEKIAFYSAAFYLLYPVNFILSGFFTEALFNLMLFASLLLARHNRFLASSVIASLLSITRSLGVFLGLPLLIIYFKQRKELGKKFPLAIASLALIPIPLFLHLRKIYELTGDWMAMFNAQAPFGRGKGQFLIRLAYDLQHDFQVTSFEIAFLVIAVLLSLLGLVFLKTRSGRRPPIEYSIYAVYSIVVPLLSGIVTSFARYSLGIFPIFMGLAFVAAKARGFKLLAFVSFLISLVFMAIWVLSSRFII